MSAIYTWFVTPTTATVIYKGVEPSHLLCEVCEGGMLQVRMKEVIVNGFKRLRLHAGGAVTANYVRKWIYPNKLVTEESNLRKAKVFFLPAWHLGRAPGL